MSSVTQPHELKKTVTHESSAVAQAKVLMAVEKGAAAEKLHHIEKPKEGLSDAEKAAYLEEKKAAGH